MIPIIKDFLVKCVEILEEEGIKDINASDRGLAPGIESRSIFYIALIARAVAHAAEELRKGNS